MKKRYVKEIKAWTMLPETVLEAVEELEEFLCADFGAGDWSPKFLTAHFKICKDQIKKIEAARQRKEGMTYAEFMQKYFPKGFKEQKMKSR
jgi:hypothetical protein